jgi:uncharacterized Zn finger protein
MSMWDDYEYVTVEEQRNKARKALEKLKKTNNDISPIIIEGRTIAKTWWGKAWNKNLESYSDYENRIGRGRSYVRNGSVLDLNINRGIVTAIVQGSTTKPYNVDIKIEEIKYDQWKNIIKSCEGKIESFQELAEGKFPKALSELFTSKVWGLFPSPREISFNCSCPDWASMCKHVAAVLYGIGARLDERPEMLFTLRNANVDDLISKAIEGKTNEMLERAETKSRRILEDDDIGALFGVEMEGAEKAVQNTKGKKLDK